MSTASWRTIEVLCSNCVGGGGGVCGCVVVSVTVAEYPQRYSNCSGTALYQKYVASQEESCVFWMYVMLIVYLPGGSNIVLSLRNPFLNVAGLVSCSLRAEARYMVGN